jgi:hypothetical protein
MRYWNRLWLILALGTATRQQDTHTCSLGTDSEWQVLRSCAAPCIWGTCCISVADIIGCPSPWYNECVCDLNQQSAAAAHVSSCVVSRCTGNAEVPTAVAVYIDYCSSAGYALATTVTAVAAQTDFRTVSLSGDNEFKVLRSCAQECIWGLCCISVADFIGCNSPWYNECVCDLNMQSSAASNVASCVSSRCTGNTDVSTAVAVYLDYCASAGYALASATQASGVTTTVAGSTNMVTKANPPVIITSVTTPPNAGSTGQTTGGPVSTDTASGPGGGYSISDKIALGVGIGIGVPTFIVTVFMCIRRF